MYQAPDSTYKNKDWLKRKIDDGLNLREIADLCGVSHITIFNWRNRHGIPSRRKLQRNKLDNAKWLRSQYVDAGLSCADIARVVGCSVSVVWQALKQHNIPTRDRIPHRVYHDKRWLIQHYRDKKMTLEQVARAGDCAVSTIAYWLGKYDIKRRAELRHQPRGKRGHHKPTKPYHHKEWLERKYVDEGLNTIQISALVGVSPSTIATWLHNHGIPVRNNRTKDWQKTHAERMQDLWSSGAYDGIFQSPTSIELQVAAALDILGIDHELQYRPDNYSRVFDEYIRPDVLIEVHGDYWHSLPEKKEADAEKKEWASQNNYNLIVLWEHEIEEFGAWSLVASRILPLVKN